MGGFGTRLRPLTFEVPKPLMDFVNVPILDYQIAALAKAGVTEIVLGINFKKELILSFLDEMAQRHKVKIVASIEDRPLGVAGPMKLAEKLLTENNTTGMFFVCNSDVITEFQFEEMIEMQKKTEALGIMCVTKVADPSKYGVVAFDENKCITMFHEKPKTFVGDCVNAGIYLFKNEVLDRLSLDPLTGMVAFLDGLVSDKKLFVTVLKEYWMDIGHPCDFLEGTRLHLGYLQKKCSEKLSKGKNIIGNVVIHPTAEVSEDAEIGPDVVIGEKCRVGPGARIKGSCLFRGSQVGRSCYIENTVLSWHSTVGDWTRIEGLSIVAEHCSIGKEIRLKEVLVLPHKAVNSNTNNSIVM